MMPGYQQGYPAQQPQPMYYPQQPQPIIVAPVINNQVNAMTMNAGYIQQQPTLGMAVRLLWFIFVGFYLGFFWIGTALFFCCTIIGLPIGIWMFNRTSKAFFLW